MPTGYMCWRKEMWWKRAIMKNCWKKRDSIMPCGASRSVKEKQKSLLHKMGIFSFLGFGVGKIKSALKRGAIVIDVRTGAEYDRGHVPDAFNIPVDRIKASAERLKAAKKPIIVCCNSGSRSDAAARQLKASGIKEVYNGGSWQQVLKLIE